MCQIYVIFIGWGFLSERLTRAPSIWKKCTCLIRLAVSICTVGIGIRCSKGSASQLALPDRGKRCLWPVWVTSHGSDLSLEWLCQHSGHRPTACRVPATDRASSAYTDGAGGNRKPHSGTRTCYFCVLKIFVWNFETDAPWQGISPFLRMICNAGLEVSRLMDHFTTYFSSSGDCIV